jgi:hypothetical protein
MYPLDAAGNGACDSELLPTSAEADTNTLVRWVAAHKDWALLLKRCPLSTVASAPARGSALAA